MIKTIVELVSDTLGLTAELFMFAMIGVVALAFVVSLVVGLLCGRFKKTVSCMREAIKPNHAVDAMKKMPMSIKNSYKNARVSNVKPSTLVTEEMCVEQPFHTSFLSYLWKITFVATIVCGVLAFMVSAFAKVPVPDGEATAEEVAEADMLLKCGPYVASALVFLVGGILTAVGALVGKLQYNSAVALYDNFAVAIDASSASGAPMMSEPQPVYSEPQAAYAEPQAAYAEPQTAYTEPQTAYAEPQTAYAEPQAAPIEPEPQPTPVETPSYDKPPVVETVDQESEAEFRKRAREEALAQARAQQAAQRAQQAAPQQPTPQPAAAPAGGSSVDEVIARIEQIERDGAPRETMREVATLLQKERAKPENKTPEKQKKLNEALSKLLKVMTAASGKK